MGIYSQIAWLKLRTDLGTALQGKTILNVLVPDYVIICW